MTVIKSFTAALLLSTIASTAIAQDYFISDAKLVTNTSQGTVETEMIKADGRWVTPGLIAPYSRLGLMDIGGEDVTNDTSSGDSKTSVSELASDSYNPKSLKNQHPLFSYSLVKAAHVARAGLAPLPYNNFVPP